MGGETAFVEGYVLDGIGIEYREHTEHVVHVIDRNTVQKQKVLIGVTSSYIEACGCLGTGLYAGQQLKGLENIGLTEHGGNGFDLLDGNIHGTHL